MRTKTNDLRIRFSAWQEDSPDERIELRLAQEEDASRNTYIATGLDYDLPALDEYPHELRELGSPTIHRSSAIHTSRNASARSWRPRAAREGTMKNRIIAVLLAVSLVGCSSIRHFAPASSVDTTDVAVSSAAATAVQTATEQQQEPKAGEDTPQKPHPVPGLWSALLEVGKVIGAVAAFALGAALMAAARM